MNQHIHAVSKHKGTVKCIKNVLVISDSEIIIASAKDSLSLSGFHIFLANDGGGALKIFSNENINFVIIDSDLISLPVCELIDALKILSEGNFIPIVALADREDEVFLSDCVSSGCDDILFKPFSPGVLKARFAFLEQVSQLKQLHINMINEQLAAKDILVKALYERCVKHEEIQVFSKNKDLFSGDLFLTAEHPDGGLHILLADFTGHGLSAAIGALPVADVFSAMTVKGFDLDFIIESINIKLNTLLPVNMFMACTVIKIDADKKHANIWSGGMPDFYLRDGNTGEIKNIIKAAHLPLGIDDSKIQYNQLTTIKISEHDQFILYTDGLTDALNDEGEMFGDIRLEQILINNFSVESVFSAIVDAFNKFCGEIPPADDVTFVCLPCSVGLASIYTDASGNKHGVSEHHNDNLDTDRAFCIEDRCDESDQLLVKRDVFRKPEKSKKISATQRVYQLKNRFVFTLQVIISKHISENIYKEMI